MNTDVEDLLREGMERYTADLRAPAGLIRRAARWPAVRAVADGARLLGGGADAGVVALAVVCVSGAGHDSAPGPALAMSITSLARESSSWV
jgi:hypothetical protein